MFNIISKDLYQKSIFYKLM